MENDASFAASSGKNSRRKSSVNKRLLLLKEQDEELQNGAQSSIFESHSKKASSALRCLHENENDGVSGNAPRKATKK